MIRLADFHKAKTDGMNEFEKDIHYVKTRIELIMRALDLDCSRERFAVENDLLALDLDEIVRNRSDNATQDQIRRLEALGRDYIREMEERGLA